MPHRAHEITAQMFWSLLPPHVGKEAGEHAQGGVNVSVHVAAHARSVEALLEPTVQSTRGGPSHVVVLVHDASQEAAARAVALGRHVLVHEGAPTLSLSTLPSPVPSPRAPVSASGRRSHTPPLPRRPPAPHPLRRQQHGQHRTSPSAAHAHAAEKREVAAVPSCRGLGRAAAGCSLGPRQGEARRAEVS